MHISHRFDVLQQPLQSITGELLNGDFSLQTLKEIFLSLSKITSVIEQRVASPPAQSDASWASCPRLSALPFDEAG